MMELTKLNNPLNVESEEGETSPVSLVLRSYREGHGVVSFSTRVRSWIQVNESFLPCKQSFDIRKSWTKTGTVCRGLEGRERHGRVKL